MSEPVFRADGDDMVSVIHASRIAGNDAGSAYTGPTAHHQSPFLSSEEVSSVIVCVATPIDSAANA